MLTQQEKEYIDLSIASGLGDEAVLRSFLTQSGWNEEKIDSALAYSHQNSSLENLAENNPYLIANEISHTAKEVDNFNEERDEVLPDSSESVIASLKEEEKNSEENVPVSLVEHFSELEKQEAEFVKINISSPQEKEDEIKILEEDSIPPQTFLKEENSPQNISSRNYQAESAPLVTAHDENGEPHSIFHLVMIFLLIFFVLVVCVVGLLFWLDIGPFSSITYTKIK